MAKEFYQILEITETATQEEIKKAYRKLSLKWHPDRQGGKSLEEKEQANKKMQEINKAYEILGNEELRKRYDNGETKFAFAASESDYSHEEELKNVSDELKKLREEQKILARKDAINIIGFEMLITEIYPRRLDSNLWSPYDKWQEKVWKIEIKDDDTSEYGIDTSKLDEFKETMINAIRKRKEEWKTGINNPYFDKIKTNAIEVIEEAMKERGLKAEDLGEYSNYQEQISNLDRQWKIRNLKDNIVVYIKNMGDNKGSEKTKKDLSFLDEFSDNQKYLEKKERIREPSQELSIKDIGRKNVDNDNIVKIDIEVNGKYDKLTREELINKIKQSELDNNHLQKIISSLKARIKELEEELAELKAEEQTPEIRKEIWQREVELGETRESLEKINFSGVTKNPKVNNSPNSDNNFPTSWVVGVGILTVVGLMSLIIIKKKSKKKNCLIA